MKKYTREQITNNSIVLIGPVGAGKSLISRGLSKKTKMPIIATDSMRHCPKTIEEIDRRQENCLNRIEQTQNEIKLCKKATEYDKLRRKLNDLFGESEMLNHQREMREILPNVSNYSEMGWNRNVSEYVYKRFGAVAWHFYQKQFENQLLKEIVTQLDRPCIIDMGGGMSVSLDKDYKEFAEQFKEIDEILFSQYFDLDKIGFSHIQTALKPFANVVELKLPLDYKKHMQKAANDELNESFIASRQNHKLATQTVNVKGILHNDKPNNQVISKIEKDIFDNRRVVVKN